MRRLTFCQHCQAPREGLTTHLIPRALRQDATPKPLGATLVAFQLCRPCAATRQEDVIEFLAGHPPTTLVSLGASR